MKEETGKKRCRELQQKRLGAIQAVEQNPSFRSKSAISVLMMRKAIIADIMAGN